jgi:hypothetical protein
MIHYAEMYNHAARVDHVVTRPRTLAQVSGLMADQE